MLMLSYNIDQSTRYDDHFAYRSSFQRLRDVFARQCQPFRLFIADSRFHHDAVAQFSVHLDDQGDHLVFGCFFIHIWPELGVN